MEDPGETPIDLSGKRVVVMGLGRFGGGVGVTRHLVKQGADVRVTDLQSEQQLGDSLRQLEGLPIQYRLGTHNISDFTTADLIVVNPAVDPRGNRFLRAAQAASIPLTSEIRLLIQSLPNPGRTIGVTGTAGKSTVTAMICHILSKALGTQRVHIGGNIGGSLLGRVDKIQRDDWVVLELSSFMLEGLASDHWSPHVAVVTNLTENHLDRHGSFGAYAAAKQVILKHQTQADHAVLGPGLKPIMHPRAGGVDWIEQPPRPAHPLLIPGQHNQLNAAMAVQAAGAAAGIEPTQGIEALSDFPGLPHRLQLVAEARGIRFYNDSKSTTPQAAMYAIGCFVSQRSASGSAPGVHAILGGYDKAVDLSGLGRYAGEHCHAVYTIGATGDTIAAAAGSGKAKVIPCGTLDLAVQQASRHAHEQAIVLLSPGCASWDQFDHYQQRGGVFIEAVLKHNTEPAP